MSRANRKENKNSLPQSEELFLLQNTATACVVTYPRAC